MYKYRNPYILDFSNIKHYGDVHKIIKEVFDFPDYYGENWSAFWDCSKGLIGDPIHIQIFGLDKFQKNFPESCAKMLEILERLRHWNDDRYINEITIEIMQ